MVELHKRGNRDAERLSKGPNWDKTTYDSN